jgi:hypothetical protein
VMASVMDIPEQTADPAAGKRSTMPSRGDATTTWG